MDQPLNGFVPREQSAEEDNRDDGDAGEVFDAAEAVGEALTGFAPRQHERDPQRNGSHGVADVVDGIGE
mgnify:CR=1 FL=1